MRHRTLAFFAFASLSSACGISFQESFDKNVRLTLGDDRATCENSNSSGPLSEAERTITSDDGNTTCFWDANQVGDECTLTVRCSFDISLEKVKEKLQEYQDQIADALTIRTLDGSVTHVQFLDHNGQPLAGAAEFTLEEIDIGLAPADSVFDVESLHMAQAYASSFASMFVGSEIVISPELELDLHAEASSDAIAAILEVFLQLPDSMRASAASVTVFDLGNDAAREFLSQLNTWIIHVTGEVDAEIALGG
jgi:hypothetical protein